MKQFEKETMTSASPQIAESSKILDTCFSTVAVDTCFL